MYLNFCKYLTNINIFLVNFLIPLFFFNHFKTFSVNISDVNKKSARKTLDESLKDNKI